MTNVGAIDQTRNTCTSRRSLVRLLSAAAVHSALGPTIVLAQQGDRVRRIGVLMSTGAADPEGEARLAAFRRGLQQLGWIEGHHARIDVRWTAGHPDAIRRYATELIALAPEVILASGGSVVGPLLQATRSIPVVFAQTPDPVAAGFVASMARPGGNATGFTQVEYGAGAKWLELLREIAPRVTRAAILRDPAIPEGIGQLAVIQAAASAFRVEVSPVDLRDAGGIARAGTECDARPVRRAPQDEAEFPDRLNGRRTHRQRDRATREWHERAATHIAAAHARPRCGLRRDEVIERAVAT